MSLDEPTEVERMMFDANLKEFANRVLVICGLESGGKISQEEAYQRIKKVWNQLKQSKKHLGIGNPGSNEG